MGSGVSAWQRAADVPCRAKRRYQTKDEVAGRLLSSTKEAASQAHSSEAASSKSKAAVRSPVPALSAAPSPVPALPAEESEGRVPFPVLFQRVSSKIDLHTNAVMDKLDAVLANNSALWARYKRDVVVEDQQRAALAASSSLPRASMAKAQKNLQREEEREVTLRCLQQALLEHDYVDLEFWATEAGAQGLTLPPEIDLLLQALKEVEQIALNIEECEEQLERRATWAQQKGDESALANLLEEARSLGVDETMIEMKLQELRSQRARARSKGPAPPPPPHAERFHGFAQGNLPGDIFSSGFYIPKQAESRQPVRVPRRRVGNETQARRAPQAKSAEVAAPRDRPELTQGAALARLGLTSNASREDVKRAYKQAALRWHPDRPQNHGSESEARINFERAKEAFDFLENAGT
eukprot:TRINITY_DN82272_c0_g1_i1.p1 TRINITY_DN82272_c0_g1~~TRINITY_DN82272_c0_g1_i1.p1  ORF type:complete len:410 (-),score=111.26 TRINITY_DN82272_c0_g1_i1:53-1282(-)